VKLTGTCPRTDAVVASSVSWRRKAVLPLRRRLEQATKVGNTTTISKSIQGVIAC